MSKLSDLHAEGVTDLYSYNVGFNDGCQEVKERIIAHLFSKLCNPCKAKGTCNHALCFERQMQIQWIEKDEEE